MNYAFCAISLPADLPCRGLPENIPARFGAGALVRVVAAGQVKGPDNPGPQPQPHSLGTFSLQIPRR